MSYSHINFRNVEISLLVHINGMFSPASFVSPVEIKLLLLFFTNVRQFRYLMYKWKMCAKVVGRNLQKAFLYREKSSKESWE